MPSAIHYGPLDLFNRQGYRIDYGCAVSHIAPDGTLVSVLWTDKTCPEMTPGSRQFRALRHIVKLLMDGSLWPSDVTFTVLAGGLGSFACDGNKAKEMYYTDYNEEQQDPTWWDALDVEFADLH